MLSHLTWSTWIRLIKECARGETNAIWGPSRTSSSSASWRACPQRVSPTSSAMMAAEAIGRMVRGFPEALGAEGWSYLQVGRLSQHCWVRLTSPTSRSTSRIRCLTGWLQLPMIGRTGLSLANYGCWRIPTTPDKITSKQLAELLDLAGSRRARTVVQHIAEHGQITTEELQQEYGYDHPPRAARDVRESGIPLKTVRVRSQQTGRLIAAYRLGDLAGIRRARAGGRRAIPRAFKQQLLALYGSRCAICGLALPGRYLQVDHRVPYEVAGDKAGEALEHRAFCLLCGSCNRAKSWSCEHCENWSAHRDQAVCCRCYWSGADDYEHVALLPTRRLDLVWSGDEVACYNSLHDSAERAGKELAALVKRILEAHTRKRL